MSRKTWHQIHRWIAISFGFFLLFWTVSGILMMLPARWFAPASLTAPESTDYRQAQVSPAQAIINLEQSLGRTIEVVNIGTTTIQDALVYKVLLKNGSIRLVDTQSGMVLKLTSEFAEQIARDRAQTKANLLTDELLTNHDLKYPFGQLPVYRVVFEDEPSIHYYVSEIDGSISRSTYLTRAMTAITSLHTFEPVRLFTQNDKIRKGLLILFSFIGILTALTGYYLAILPYLRRKSKSSTSQEPQGG